LILVSIFSLALPTLEKPRRADAEVHRSLVPGGSLSSLSVEHPIFTAPAAPVFDRAAGRRIWRRLLSELGAALSTDWLDQRRHQAARTLATYLNMLLRRARGSAKQCREWGPTEEQISAHPNGRNERQRRCSPS